MEENRLTDDVLEKAGSAGITPPASKYNCGDCVDYRNSDRIKTYGIITNLYYLASKETWIYTIVMHVGDLTVDYVPEADIIGYT